MNTYASEERKEKFKNYIKAIKECNVSGAQMIVASLSVLGDTVEEIDMSLNIARQFGVTIHITDLNMNIA